MASAENENKLMKWNDSITDYLLIKIASFVYFEPLQALAMSHLGYSKAHYQRTVVKSDPQQIQIFEILVGWSNRKKYTIKYLVDQIGRWQADGFVDPAIWDELKKYISSDVITDRHIYQLASRFSSQPVSQQPARSYGFLSWAKFLFAFLSWVPLPKFVKDKFTFVDTDSKKRSRKEVDDNDETQIKRSKLSLDITRVIKLTKESIRRKWKNCMANDWLPQEKMHIFPLKENYFNLTWMRNVRRPSKNFQEELHSIYDLVKEPDFGAQNILIEGKPGVGKTCSMASIALNWVDGKKELKHFDLVFLIRLRYVDKTSSLADLIIAQHDRLGVKKVPKETIEAILEGKTDSRVLLIFDGYDEYKKGTNKEIDEAIESTVGDCFLILTSRPEKFVSIEIRQKMDGEIMIQGLSDDSILEYVYNFFEEDEDTSIDMLRQAESIDIYELLCIPIILLMVCVIFYEKNALPESMTQIVSSIYRMIVDRTTLKTLKKKSKEMKDLEDMLDTLGKFAWEAFQKENGQLLLNENELKKHNPNILLLGVLSKTVLEEVTSKEQPTWLEFPNKLLQEYSGADYISRRINTQQGAKDILKTFFPSLGEMDMHQQIVIFLSGLLNNPSVLFEYVCDLCFEDNGDQSRQQYLHLWLKSLAAECPGHQHNTHLQYLHESEVKPITTPSRLYVFDEVEKNVSWKVKKSKNSIPQEITQCLLCIFHPAESVVKALLSVCNEISKYQRTTHLCIEGLQQNKIETNNKSVNLCNQAESIYIKDSMLSSNLKLSLSTMATTLIVEDCEVSPVVMNHLLQQLQNCTKLLSLVIERCQCESIKFSTVVLEGIGTSLTCLSLRDMNLTQVQCRQLCKQIRHLKNLEVLNLSGNHLCGSLTYLSPSDKGPTFGTPKRLMLYEAYLNADDLLTLEHLLRSDRLTWMNISKNNLSRMEGSVRSLCQTAVSQRQLHDLQVFLGGNDFSDAFITNLKFLCNGTQIQLSFL